MKEPAKQFAIAPLNVRVGNASLDLAQPLPISIDAVINGHAPFKAEGTVTPEPLAAQLDVSLAKARMTILQPYVLPLADLTIKAGELGTERQGPARSAGRARPGPEFRWRRHDRRLQVGRQRTRQGPRQLPAGRARQAAASRWGPTPSASTRSRSASHSHASSSARSASSTLPRCSTRKGTAAALEARRAAGGGRGEDDSGRQASSGTRRRRAGRVAGRKGAARHRVVRPPRPPRRRCRPKVCRSGSARCGSTTGPWISPTSPCSRTSRREVTRLNGTLTGLSSDPASHAKVDLKGAVGEFSPVTISGRDPAVRVRALHGHRSQVREHLAADLQPVLRPACGLFDRQGQAHHRPALPHPGPQARCAAQDPHRPARVGRGDRGQRRGDAAGQVRHGAAQGPQRSDRARRPGHRLDRRSEVPHRPDRLAGHQEHPRKGGHGAVRAARLAVRGCGGSAVRGFRAGQRHARSCDRRAPGRARRRAWSRSPPSSSTCRSARCRTSTGRHSLHAPSSSSSRSR